MRKLLVFAVAVLPGAVLAGLLATAPRAQSQTAVSALTLEIRVEPDGALSVRETRRYDFGRAAPATVSRELPSRVGYDGERDQVYEISDVRARVGDEAVPVTQSAEDGVTTVLIELDERLAGEREVSLAYLVRGTVRPTGEGLELMWQAVRTDAPVGQVTVRVSAPAVTWAACFAGLPGSSMPCTATQITDIARPRFDQDGLPANGQMTVIVGMPADAGVRPDQTLIRRWTFGTAFAVTPVSAGLTGVLIALSALGVLALWRTRGRDRPPDAVSGGKPLDHAPSASALEPPDDVQPGQLGTVVNQRADVVDVVGTVLDLAVRGHLRIEEGLEDAHLMWRLHRGSQPPEGLHDYERAVLDQLFDGGRDHVTLAEVADQMREGLPAIQDRLYADVVEQGWFVERPDTARNRWTTAGVVLVLTGVVVTLVLAAFTDLGLAGLGMIAAGAVLAWGGVVAPARAPRGSALLPRLHDFREELATVDVTAVAPTTANRLLPYAVIFGVEGRWMQVAAQSESLPSELQDFVTTLSGVISARRLRI